MHMNMNRINTYESLDYLTISMLFSTIKYIIIFFFLKVYNINETSFKPD